MSKNWPPESREKARQRCLRVKPWEQSTGPKTRTGKLICAQNALKTGYYSTSPIIREAARRRLWEEQAKQIGSRLVALIKKGRKVPQPLQDAADLLLREPPEGLIVCPRCLSSDIQGRGLYHQCRDCGSRFGV